MSCARFHLIYRPLHSPGIPLKLLPDVHTDSEAHRLVVPQNRRLRALVSFQALGATDPEGTRDPQHPIAIGAVHATILRAVGIDPAKVMTSPIGRTVRLAEGEPLRDLLW